MQLCGSLNLVWHCLSLRLEWKLTFSSPVATAEFSKFASILSPALSQYHFLRIWNSSTGVPSPPLALYLGVWLASWYGGSRNSVKTNVTEAKWTRGRVVGDETKGWSSYYVEHWWEWEKLLLRQSMQMLESLEQRREMSFLIFYKGLLWLLYGNRLKNLGYEKRPKANY